jgi:hypothetical protein
MDAIVSIMASAAILYDYYLFCKWAVQKFDSDLPESCVQVFKLAADGHVGCHVGYLPRHLVGASRNKEDGHKDGGKSYDGVWLPYARRSKRRLDSKVFFFPLLLTLFDCREEAKGIL